MDPQVKSAVTSFGLAVATAVASWAASKGLISDGDRTNFTTALVTVGGFLVAAALTWWKARQHSQPALIQAVNEADNGVKVVASTAAAPQVNEPLKS